MRRVKEMGGQGMRRRMLYCLVLRWRKMRLGGIGSMLEATGWACGLCWRSGVLWWVGRGHCDSKFVVCCAYDTMDLFPSCGHG